MRARDPDAPRLPSVLHWQHHIHRTVVAQRLLKLRNLVSLWQIGIKVLLSIKLARRPNLRPQRRTDRDSLLHHRRVEHWKRPGMSHAHRAHPRVRFGAVLVRAPTKRLCARVELHVRLDPDHRLELGRLRHFNLRKPFIVGNFHRRRRRRRRATSRACTPAFRWTLRGSRHRGCPWNLDALVTSRRRETREHPSRACR